MTRRASREELIALALQSLLRRIETGEVFPDTMSEILFDIPAAENQR